VRIIPCIEDPVVTRKNLDHLKTKYESLRIPPVARKRADAWCIVRLTPQSSFNPGRCALEAHGREPAGRSPEMARIWRWRGG